MNFTAKSRYALKIMLDLADLNLAGKQQRNQIAKRHGISIDFMDHILARLRHQQLIESTRGRFGGFELKRSPESISLWDIFTAAEDHLFPVQCVIDHTCEFEKSCISYDAWSDVFSSIEEVLKKRTLDELAKKWQKKKNLIDQKNFPIHTGECRAPSKQVHKNVDKQYP